MNIFFFDRQMINTESKERNKNQPDDIELLTQRDVPGPTKKYPPFMYKMQSVQPIKGVQFTSASNTAIQAQGGQTSTFQLPVGSMVSNLYHMSLTFSIAVGEVNAGAPLSALTGAVNTLPTIWRYFCPFFQSIRLKSGNGTYLVNVPNVDKYSRMISGYIGNYNSSGSTARGFQCKSQRQTNVNPVPLTAATSPALTPIITDPYVDSDTAYAAIKWNAEDVDDVGILTYPTNTNYNGGVSPFPYQNVTTSVGTQVFVFNYNIPFRDLLPHSAFNVDTMIPFGNNAQIEVDWNPINSVVVPVIAQTFNGANIPFSFTGQNATTVFGNNVAYEVYNFTLNYCYLRNQDLAQDIMMQNMVEDIPLIVPYIDFTIPQATPGASANQVSTMRISSNNAYTSLEQIFFAIFKPQAGDLLMFNGNNSSNIGENIYTALNIILNGDIIANYDLKNYKNDFLQMLSYYPCLNERSYSAIRYSGSVPYVFDTEPTCCDYDGKSMRGIPIVNSNDLVLTFQASIAANTLTNLQHYLCHVTNRSFYIWQGNIFTNKQLLA
jgi:hypothetical protein